MIAFESEVDASQQELSEAKDMFNQGERRLGNSHPLIVFLFGRDFSHLGREREVRRLSHNRDTRTTDDSIEPNRTSSNSGATEKWTKAYEFRGTVEVAQTRANFDTKSEFDGTYATDGADG